MTREANQPAYSYVYQPMRKRAVKLVWPGQTEPGARLGRDAVPLTNLAIDALASIQNLKHVELLSVTGETTQDYYISANMRSVAPDDLDKPVQSRLASFEDVESIVPERPIERLAGIAVDTVPTPIGVEIVDVDLGPLRLWPVTTGRLLLETNRTPTATNFSAVNPFVAMMQAFAASQKPHVVHVIISEGSKSDYIVTLRYAVLDPEHAIATERDSLEHMRTGKQFDVDEVWHDAGLRLNFDVPIRDFFALGRNAPIPNRRMYMAESDSRTARKIYEGTVEYRDLLRGRPGADHLYDRLNLHGRIPVDEPILRQFTMGLPVYYQESPWDRSPGRAAPLVDTRDVVRHANGTEQSMGHTIDAVPESPSIANEGGAGHVSLLAFAIEYFRGQGDEARTVEQDGGSVGDGIRIVDSETRITEAEDTNVSKPAKTLTNYARAHSRGLGVDFVTDTKSHAQSIANVLKAPYTTIVSSADDPADLTGVKLYNLAGTVSHPAGGDVVLPDQNDTAEWYLIVDGELYLYVDGERIAQGDAEARLETLEYDAPRYVSEGGSHRIETADGAVIEEYRSRQRLLDDWTLLHAPFVPPDVHCLDDVQVFYKKGDTLERLSLEAPWDDPEQSKTERYQVGMREVIDDLTVHTDGDAMPYATLQEVAQEWFRVRSIRSPPNKTHIGRALPPEIDRDEAGVAVREVHDRRLLYPRGLESPAWPFIDDETETVDETNAEDENEDEDNVETLEADTDDETVGARDETVATNTSDGSEGNGEPSTENSTEDYGA